MSTYYYLACHDCKLIVAAARDGSVEAGPLHGDEHLPQFVVDHCGHSVGIVTDGSDEFIDYREYNGPNKAST